MIGEVELAFDRWADSVTGADQITYKEAFEAGWKAAESKNVTSISPHPNVPQPETNLPISGLGGYDQVLRDEFEDGKK
jgi:hypothetical protein